MSRYSRPCIPVLALLFCTALIALMPHAAWAQEGGFTCNGSVPAGELFLHSGSCDANSQSIFSSLICTFEEVLSEVFSSLYCAMQDALIKPFAALLTLYVTIFGVMFITGITPFTAREAMKNLVKIALVWAFATKAEYGIEVAYRFFITASQEGVSIVLSALLADGETGMTGADAIRHMDQIVMHDILPANPSDQGGGVGEEEAGWDACKKSVLVMVALLLFAVPPLFLLVAYSAIQIVMIFGRAVVGYLMSITGITFLMTLSPLFLSFALFKPTYQLFEKWLHYLISFALQMLVVFAFIALMEIISTGNFLAAMLDTIQPYKQVLGFGPFRWDMDACSVCEYTIKTVNGLEVPVCNEPLKVIPLFELMKHNDFIFLVVTKLVALILLGYALEAFLRSVPEIAKQLAGSPYAPRVGGATPATLGEGGTIPLMGGETIGAFKKGLISGFANAKGTTPTRIAGAVRNSFSKAGDVMLAESRKELGSLGRMGKDLEQEVLPDHLKTQSKTEWAGFYRTRPKPK